MKKQPVLFNVPATGKPVSRAKPATVKINKVNKEVAKLRYYLHRHLPPEFVLDAAHRQIKAPYACYADIPVGPARYYIGRLIRMGYNVQYELPL